MKAIVCLIATLVANTFSFEYRLVGGVPKVLVLDKTIGVGDGKIAVITGDDALLEHPLNGTVLVDTNGAYATGLVNEGGEPTAGAEGSVVKDGTNLVLGGEAFAIAGPVDTMGGAESQLGGQPEVGGMGIVEVGDKTSGAVAAALDPNSAYALAGGNLEGIVEGTVGAVVA